MKMYIVKKQLLFIILFFLSGASYSAECEKPSNEAVGHWGELNRLSHKLGYIMCIEAEGGQEGQALAEQPADSVYGIWESKVRQSAIEMDEVIFGGSGDKKFQELTKAFINDVEQALAPMLGIANTSGLDAISKSISLPAINTKEDDSPENIGLLKVNIWTKGQSIDKRFEVRDLHKGDLVKRCKERFNEARRNHCIAYAKAWSKAVSAYSGQLSKIAPAQMSLSAVKYSKDWENFYSLSRAQTFIDTIYTSYRYRHKLGGAAFVKAPDSQYFLFRPGIVMEYVRDVTEGNRFKEALSFEWYGFNYWRKCPYWFDKACGMSLVSTFSDRAGSDDYNLGLMFHYDNNLSLGIVRGLDDKEDTGVFVTIDLLKALETKEERLRAWKKTVKDNLADFNK